MFPMHVLCVLRRDENRDSLSSYTREADGEWEGEVDQSPKSFFVIELKEHFVPKSACDRDSLQGAKLEVLPNTQ